MYDELYIPVSPRPRHALVRILRVLGLLFLRLLVHLAVAVHAVALLVPPESWLVGEELGERERMEEGGMGSRRGGQGVWVCGCVWV